MQLPKEGFMGIMAPWRGAKHRPDPCKAHP